MKNILKTGVGLSMGSVIISKMAGDGVISGNVQNALRLSSIGMTIETGKGLIDQTNKMFKYK